tara:strand:- start:1236 stop:1700 length:465 start_codon:yes stop_codon:yes gene_type:complete
MSLGKHLVGCTVDAKGHTLGELLKRCSDECKRSYDNCNPDHVTQWIRQQTWYKIRSLLITILTNHGIKHEFDKMDDVVWLTKESYDDLCLSLNFGIKLEDAIYSFRCNNYKKVGQLTIWLDRYSGIYKQDKEHKARKLLLEHLPEEMVFHMGLL